MIINDKKIMMTINEQSISEIYKNKNMGGTLKVNIIHVCIFLIRYTSVSRYMEAGRIQR